MKPMNRAELRKPKKDRSHLDYKSSMMLSTGEIRQRPARRRCEPMVVRCRLSDGTFKDVSAFTEADAGSYYAAIRGTRAERRAARDAGLARAGRKLASGICCGDFNAVPTAPAVRKGDALC